MFNIGVNDTDYVIDIHSHTNSGSKYDTVSNETHSAELNVQMENNKSVNIKQMFCSTFSSVLSCEEIEKENDYMYNLSLQYDNLYQWVVIDPRNEKTFTQAKRMLNNVKCVGIKLHPVYHGYSLTQYGDRLFSFASEYNSTVLIHPETDADYILPFADKFPDVNFIIAHLGAKDGTKYADAIELSKNHNVYTDTSGGNISKNRILEYTVDRVGSEHILFGTDNYSPASQYGRIVFAQISEKDKENILRQNAKKLFNQFLK